MTLMKRIEANRRNGRHGNGPKTQVGKRMSSRNSRKHGLLTDELVIPPEDQATFDALRAGFWIDLNPAAEILKLLFEDIIVNSWKLKQAVRWEQAELQKKLEELDKKVSSGLDPICSEESAESAQRWTYWDIRGKIRLLEDLAEDCKVGYVSERWCEPLNRAFGPEFYETLADWKPTGGELVAMLESWVWKDRNYNPESLPSEEDQQAALSRQGKLEDPLRQQMLAKLISLERQHWEFYMRVHGRDLSRSTESSHSDPLDIAVRYQTSIWKDLYRAINEYYRLQKDLNLSKQLAAKCFETQTDRLS
jgi:hypothetical protein